MLCCAELGLPLEAPMGFPEVRRQLLLLLLQIGVLQLALALALVRIGVRQELH